jgi:hypothetical protein
MDLNFLISWKEKGEKPVWETVSPCSPAVKYHWSRWDTLYLKAGILYRKWENADEISTAMRSKEAPTLYCWSGACGFLLGRFLDAQISQCLHQFSTSCLCLNQENLSLTFERV